MTKDQIVAELKALGWRIRNDGDYMKAVEDFQRGWNLGDPLAIDGKAGSKTQAALLASRKRRLAGQGTASAHFSFVQFRCKCGGRYSSCRRIRVHRALLRALEAYRVVAGSFTPTSGYRCPGHNAAQGGASSSQHLYGAACDVPTKVKWGAVARLRRFSGIGYVRSTGLVAHVDVRHLSGNNTTSGSPDRPTTWQYR